MDSNTSLLPNVGVFCLPVAAPEDGEASKIALQAMFRDIQTAERYRLGFAWIAEHLSVSYGGVVPNPLTAIAAVGQQVSRIALGSAVTLASIRHPLLIAQEAQLVSRLIKGPLHLGLGRGFLRCDLEAFGVSQERASVDFWMAINSLSTLSKDTQWVQNLWVATTSEEGAKTVGELGLGLALNPYTKSGEAIDRSIEIYRKNLRKCKMDGKYKVLIHEPLYLHENARKAAAMGRSHFEYYLAAQKHAEKSGFSTVDSRHMLGIEDYAAKCAFCDGKQFADRLVEWRNRGVTHWCFLVRFGKLNEQSILKTIALCAKTAALIPRGQL